MTSVQVVFTDNTEVIIEKATSFHYSEVDRCWKITVQAEHISVNADCVKYIGNKSHIDGGKS